ncbi:hypothetical protein HX004_15685 [Myroides sp. 1354]|uniref:hypothetical protein n=1 Tax=unclassified Myroides TaxID=2642485 RepID=UPI002577B6BB|nr:MULTISPECIES: hypothetical protein [unclassified Myroides]MDM1046264.1 hypothetical protein [Myroides sp. R163-1]MDM1057200.1 hypothetical protein [Myroides sp. 1354]MDM1070395.1 hypothetical protein [Myroides sp. 1372]
MKKLTIILCSTLLFMGCAKKKENNTPMEPTTADRTQTDTYRIKLNSIEGEPGLADYAKEGKEVQGEIIQQLNGSDGSEYYVVKLDQPFEYSESESTAVAKANYLIVGGRFREQPLQKGANHTVVNVAIVVDDTVLTDEQLDFSKAIFAGMGEATEIK